jgi:hypothetical protein
MATQEQLENALRNAAAKARAGDERAAQAARRLAAELKAVRAPQQPAAVEMTPEELNANNARLTGTDVNLDPTAGNSFLQNLAIGAGKSVADTGRGLAQLVGRGMTPEQVAEQRQIDAPIMATGGGITGNILGQVAQIAVPVGGGARLASVAGKAAPYVSAAARGGAFAASQPIATGESRGANAAAGAALGAVGQGIASGAGRLATKAKEVLNPVVRQSIDAARNMGIPLNVSQTSASPAIRAAQAATKWLPFSGAAKSAQRQQESFNRAVGKTFGADASTLSDDVMRAARKKLSAGFDDIYSRNDVAVTPDTARRFLALERRALADMTDAESKVIRNQIDEILRAAETGSMSGRKYQALRTQLQRVEKRPDAIGSAVRQVRTELDEAAAASVGPRDADALAKLRSGWANLRTTEDALSQVSGASGNVRPASLFPLIRKGATPEMRVLAKVGQNVLKDGVGDSGTAQRVLYQQLLTGGVGAPAAMAADVAGLAGGGLLAGRALNSNVASKLLAQGRPTAALAGLARPAPRLLPTQAAGMAGVMDIGNVTGYDPNDPRYRGD